MTWPPSLYASACRRLVAAFALVLLYGASGLAQEAPDTPAERLARGQAIYQDLCAGCHGDDGEATMRGESTKTLPGIHIRRTDYEIGHRIRGLMATLFTEEERADLVAFVKSLKGKKGYARPELLIDGTALKPFVTDPGVRIVDLRSAEAYAAAHLPNAVHIDAAALRPLPDAATFARLMEEIGVGDATYVVAYDAGDGRAAALLWAALHRYGHTRVSLLDGGWQRWVEEGRYTTPWKPARRSVTFTPRPQDGIVVTPADLEILIQDRRIRLLDVRPSPLSETAAHLPWTDNLQADGTLRPADELLERYATAGVTPDRIIVTIGTDMAEAALSMFTLRLLGYADVRLYSPYPASGTAPEFSARWHE